MILLKYFDKNVQLSLPVALSPLSLSITTHHTHSLSVFYGQLIINYVVKSTAAGHRELTENINIEYRKMSVQNSIEGWVGGVVVGKGGRWIKFDERLS